jgi:hypothetical protein
LCFCSSMRVWSSVYIHVYVPTCTGCVSLCLCPCVCALVCVSLCVCPCVCPCVCALVWVCAAVAAEAKRLLSLKATPHSHSAYSHKYPHEFALCCPIPCVCYVCVQWRLLLTLWMASPVHSLKNWYTPPLLPSPALSHCAFIRVPVHTYTHIHRHTHTPSVPQPAGRSVGQRQEWCQPVATAPIAAAVSK